MTGRLRKSQPVKPAPATGAPMDQDSRPASKKVAVLPQAECLAKHPIVEHSFLSFQFADADKMSCCLSERGGGNRLKFVCYEIDNSLIRRKKIPEKIEHSQAHFRKDPGLAMGNADCERNEWLRFPVYFPDHGNFPSESGSHQTRPTASESTPLPSIS